MPSAPSARSGTVFIFKHPSCVFPPHFSPQCIKMHKISINFQILKILRIFWGTVLSPKPWRVDRAGWGNFLQLLQLKYSLQKLLSTGSRHDAGCPAWSWPSLLCVGSRAGVCCCTPEGMWAKETVQAAPDKDFWLHLWTLLCRWNIYDDMLPSNDQIALNRQEIKYTMGCGNYGRDYEMGGGWGRWIKIKPTPNGHRFCWA